MLRLSRRPSSSLLLFTSTCLLLSGCVGWAPLAINGKIPPRSDVRVTRRDGTTLWVVDPTIRGDSLHGWGLKRSQSGPPPTVAMPISDVQKLEVRKFNGQKTAGVAFVVFSVLFAFISSVRSDNDEWW